MRVCSIALQPAHCQPGCLRVVLTPEPRAANASIFYDAASLLVVPEEVARELGELVQVGGSRVPPREDRSTHLTRGVTLQMKILRRCG